MTTSPAPAPLPRADVARDASGAGAFFAFGSTRLRGLDLVFLLLCVYFFIAIAAIDQEWEEVARFRPRLLLGTFILLAAIVRIVRAMSSTEGRIRPPDAISTWWGVYAAVTLVAALWAFDFALAKEELLQRRLTSLLCFPLIVANVRTRREFLVLVLVFCAASGFYLLRSLMEYLNGRYDVAMGVKRMVGAGGVDPNSLAASVVFSLPLVLWAGLHTRSWFLRLCAVSYGVLSVLAIALTRSRSGLVLLALAVVWLLIALPRGRVRTAGLVLVVLAALVASTTLSEDAIRRYQGMLTGGSTQSEKESTEGRIRGYVVAWEIFTDHPVLGVGPGNWAAYREKKVDGSRLLPHNLPGQVIATLGLLGAVSFAGLLLATFSRGLDERRRRKTSPEPWDVAVRALVGAMLATLFLHLVSGLAAHNLDRWAWSWAPAFIVVATTCRAEATKETT